MEVGFDPGHIVLDGDQAPLSKKGAQPPIFGPCLAQTAGWIKMPLGMEIGLDQSDIVLDGDPVPLHQNGGTAPILDPYLLWPNYSMDQYATW